MDYRLSPSAYAEEQRKVASNYAQNKRAMMDFEVKKSKRFKFISKLRDLPKKVLPYDSMYDTSFKSYLLTFCVELAILIFFLAVMAGAILPAYFIATDSDLKGIGLTFACIGLFLGGALSGTIAGFIAGGIGGFLYGAILAIVLIPIAYPLYRLVIPLKERQREKRENKIAFAEQRIKQPFLDDIQKKYSEAEENIKKYTAEFKKESIKVSKKFADSEFTKKIAEIIANRCELDIRNANRAANKKTVELAWSYKVFKDKVYFLFEHKFEDYRYEQIQDFLSKCALARAIAEQVCLKINEKYQQDPSGTHYKMISTLLYETDRSEEVVKVKLDYTAPNGNYEPVKKW